MEDTHGDTYIHTYIYIVCVMFSSLYITLFNYNNIVYIYNYVCVCVCIHDDQSNERTKEQTNSLTN